MCFVPGIILIISKIMKFKGVILNANKGMASRAVKIIINNFCFRRLEAFIMNSYVTMVTFKDRVANIDVFKTVATFLSNKTVHHT